MDHLFSDTTTMGTCVFMSGPLPGLSFSLVTHVYLFGMGVLLGVFAALALYQGPWPTRASTTVLYTLASAQVLWACSRYRCPPEDECLHCLCSGLYLGGALAAYASTLF